MKVSSDTKVKYRIKEWNKNKMKIKAQRKCEKICISCKVFKKCTAQYFFCILFSLMFPCDIFCNTVL